jgi:hypothetical protein
MDAKTYTVYITPAGGERTLLAENYAFRATATDTADLGKVFFVSAKANDELKADSVMRMAMYTEGKEYWSFGENYGWQQHPIYLGRAFTGNVKISYDMFSTLEAVNASIDFADGERDVYGFGDLSILVRMNDGAGKWVEHIGPAYFDAFNVDKTSCNEIVYHNANKTYHIDIEANMEAGTYDVWVTTPEGVKTQIADDYAFRMTAADAKNISRVYVISANASDQVYMKNLKIEDALGSN